MNLGKWIISGALIAMCSSVGFGADVEANSVHTVLEVSDGESNVQVGDIAVRIIKAHVSLLTAHSFDTYMFFVLPGKESRSWLHILIDEPDSILFQFRTVESADSTVQAILVYRDRGALSVVQATKIGEAVPHLYLNKTRVRFRIYKFNQNLDSPRFVLEQERVTRLIYTNASDAIDKEFFTK